MARAAITFDFHDTIARCDEWFQIEVRHLPSAFFAWQARLRGHEPDEALMTIADARYRQLRQAIHRHGHELPAERAIIVIAEALGVVVDPDEVACGVRRMMLTAFQSVAPVEGAVETIRDLHAANLQLGVVSSAVYHPFLIWTLEQFGIRHCFGDVTTSASAGYYKSRPEIFWQTIERLEAVPQRSVHVGDSLRFDIGGARRAGMKAVWLNGRGAADDEAPNLTVTSMHDLAPRLIALLHGVRQ